MFPEKLKYYLKESSRRINHVRNSIADLRPKLLILVYHRVLPKITDNPLETIVSREAFITQTDLLAAKFPIVSLSEAISHCQRGAKNKEIKVALTFDDGYRDNYETAFPVLEKKGLPAAFFVTTDYVGSDMPLWDWEAIMRLSYNANIDEVRTERCTLKRKEGESQLSFALRLFQAMRYTDALTLRSVMDFLRQAAPACDFRDDGFMSWTQIKDMSGAGMEIGAHGASHRSLGSMPLAEASDEIIKSKLLIEENTQKDCCWFAFPFGSKRDYNEALIEKVKEAQFRACLLNIHGYNHMASDTFCLKRIIMKESTNLNFLLG